MLEEYLKKNRITEVKPSEIEKVTKSFLLFFDFINKPVNRSNFINTLIGRNNSLKMKDQTSIFGSLNDLNYDAVKKYLFYFISLDYISIVKHSSYTFIVKNNKTKNLIRDVNNFDINSFKMPNDENNFINIYIRDLDSKKSNLIDEKIVQNNKFSNVEEINYDKKLYDILAKKRSDIALERNIPSYMVVNNQTLKLITEIKPVTEESMLSIYGMGKKKFDSFGNQFLNLIKLYLIKNEEEQYVDSMSDLNYIFSGKRFISKKEIEEIYNLYNKNEIKKNQNYDKYFENLKILEDFRELYNEKFVKQKLIEEKQYLDSILEVVDPVIKLDKKQREVVLRDEDYTLVVAGAGSGKTTTVAAKVKYLVDKKKTCPEKILIVSYTNKAVDELKDRINKQLKIPAIISTFHKVGYALVKKTRDNEQIKVARDAITYNIIREYLNVYLKNKPDELRALIMFFGYYIDAPISGTDIESFIRHFQRNDFTTLKTNIKQITEQLIDNKAANKSSIQHEVMRSLEEVQIANFLYLNSVDYEYEASYPFVLEGSSKIYTPDFTIRYKDKVIYLEHFGISQDGKCSRYTESELERYKKNINDKILLHRKRNTILIYTFSTYIDGKDLLQHLKELLEQSGIELIPRSVSEVYKTIANEESNKYFNRFVFFVKDFISSFKTNGYTEKDFEKLMNKTDNVRIRLFLNICKPIYMHYQKELYENNFLDFEDMINESARLLENPEFIKQIPEFEYVIIDEYQDISRQRFDLTKALSDLTKAKLIAVGDDWQSIFAFAGSRIDLFLKFKGLMGYADYLTIDHTYRNAQEVINIAGDFIQKNSSQLKKNLISPKNIDIPIILYEYNDITYKNEIKGYKGIIIEKAKILNKIISSISRQYGTNQTIAVLGRYNFEEQQLTKTDLFYLDKKANLRSKNFPKVKLIFSTIHNSKGLGFDNVIILNGSNEVYGFPSQIEMDPIFKLVKYYDQTISYAEERRLFYVALTRTKNQVHILYPKTKPSSFVLELANNYDLVKHPSDITEKAPLQDRKDKLCPICGYPLQLKKNRAYGFRLFMCSNEPELCGYLTNNLRSGKESISKCTECMTGYLVVKHSIKKDQYFFGCTNYRKDGKGCNKTKPIDYSDANK
ncbi:MAG: UvrD-helicase domain-containing protein [Bacilli bacterium]|nr:UvrD-helicase domain-containing protein [Bacilli bacterium]